MYVGQTEIAAGVAVGQLHVIEAQQVQHCGVQVVQVVQVDFVFDGVVVGLAVADAGLRAAGQPLLLLFRLPQQSRVLSELGQRHHTDQTASKQFADNTGSTSRENCTGSAA